MQGFKGPQLLGDELINLKKIKAKILSWFIKWQYKMEHMHEMHLKAINKAASLIGGVTTILFSLKHSS